MVRIISFLLLAGVALGVVAKAEQPGGDHEGEVVDPAKDYLKKYVGKVRAELLLDDATGFLTYQLRSISDEPVKIHMASLDQAEIEFLIEPDAGGTKVRVGSEDEVQPSANTTLPYGVKAEMVGVGSPRWNELRREEEREKALDRVVELKKNEAVSRSFYLYDMPWFDTLVKKLETKKFKAYRIAPWPFVYTADAEGKPIIDHHVEVWNYEDAHKRKFNVVYYTGGLIFDLARAKKIQALRPAEKKQEQEKK